MGRRRKVSAKATSPDGGVLQQESGQRRSAWNHRPGAEAPCRQVPASPIKEMELCTTGSAKPRRQPRGRLRLLASRGLCLALATPNPPSPRAAQSFPPDGTTLPLLGARAQPAAEAPASASAPAAGARLRTIWSAITARGEGNFPRVARPVFQPCGRACNDYNVQVLLRKFAPTPPPPSPVVNNAPSASDIAIPACRDPPGPARQAPRAR